MSARFLPTMVVDCGCFHGLASSRSGLERVVREAKLDDVLLFLRGVRRLVRQSRGGVQRASEQLRGCTTLLRLEIDRKKGDGGRNFSEPLAVANKVHKSKGDTGSATSLNWVGRMRSG